MDNTHINMKDENFVIKREVLKKFRGAKIIAETTAVILKKFKGVGTIAVIPEGIELIGGGAFEDCAGLVEVFIPEGVRRIGMNAFEDCTGLVKAHLPHSLTYIDYNAFANCTSLAEINIPDRVDHIYDGAFYGCTALAEIRLPESLDFIGDYAFEYSGLTKIYLPASVSYLGNTVGTFDGCAKLSAIEVSEDNPHYFSNDGVVYTKNDNTLFCYPSGSEREAFKIPDGVPEIWRKAFSHSAKLRVLQIPDSVVRMEENPLKSCTGLQSIEVSEQNPEFSSKDGVLCDKTGTVLIRYPPGIEETSPRIPAGVTEIEYSAFRLCANLTEIRIPDGVTKIGSVAFGYCRNLRSIWIPDSVTEIGWYTFEGCTALTSIRIPVGVTEIGKSAFEGCTSLAEIPIPDSVTKIGKSAFEGCTALTAIQLPDGVTEIGKSAFEGCTSLTNVQLPDGVTKIGESAFKGCTSLATARIPKRAKIAYEAFLGCDAFKSWGLYPEDEPETPEEWYAQGREFLFQGRTAIAITALSKAIELQPDFASAYSDRGRAYSNKGEYDTAVADYTKAIALSPTGQLPDEGDYYVGRAEVYFDMNNTALGALDCKKALQLNPENSYAKHIYEYHVLQEDQEADAP